MNNIDPKILELAKRDYGENCELVKRTEWSYSFKCGPKSYCSISRFMAEKGFAVSASEMRQRWPSMNERERMDFASNFHVKEAWTVNDTETLEIRVASFRTLTPRRLFDSAQSKVDPAPAGGGIVVG